MSINPNDKVIKLKDEYIEKISTELRNCKNSNMSLESMIIKLESTVSRKKDEI